MTKTGLTLKLGKKSHILRDANLLIVTDNSACLREIEQVLQTMTIRLHYNCVTSACPDRVLTKHQYDLIIYNYSQNKNSHQSSSLIESECFLSSATENNGKDSRKNDPSYPIKELAWWYNLSPKIPLILIAEPLGEQRAIACMRSGISDYLLRSQLYLLPYILESTLSKFLTVKSDPVSQLSQQIRQLEQELNFLREQNNLLKNAEINSNQDYFSHLNHELRSPLANILQFARMLKDEIYGKLNPKQTEYISGILTSGSHLSDLINDYLDMAKIDAHHEELFPEKVAVEDICEASLVMVQGKAKEKELELVLKVAKDIDFCYADSLRLKQILINLLSNAIKFTEQGSVTLEVKATSKMHLFAVIDTGIGITEADSAKLFQPFQQINTPLHRKHKGTGLGLALSRKLAQLHGGDISLTSQPGEGSCFTVSLPRHNT